MKRLFVAFVLLFYAAGSFCFGSEAGVVAGAERLEEFRHLLEGKRVGVVVGSTTHRANLLLVDALLASGVDVQLIFTPAADSSVHTTTLSRDAYTGIEVIRIAKAPKANDVFRCDVILYDVEDTGIRTSEALKALYRMMNVCADIHIPLILLDRPNPCGSMVDGAIVEPIYRTSEELLPLPLVHGMTLGELARMINGKGWLTGEAKCPLTVVPYLESTSEIPTATDDATPSESFALLSAGLVCEVPIVFLQGDKRVSLSDVVDAYGSRNQEEEFFLGEEFNRQMGASYVRDMIEMGFSAHEIESMWSADAENFYEQRKEFLIYEE